MRSSEAAVPSNLASVIYNNTNGGVQILAVNTLGVLNIVERGDSVQSIKDLAGKKLYATGQGATPEYTLRHILKQNGIDPDSGLTIQWCADTTEALSYIANDSEAIAMRDGVPVELTPKEFMLLEIFVRNKNITLFRDKIYELVWENDNYGDTRTLDLHVQRLRKKLGLTDKLRTIYKVGYRLED